VLCAGENKGDVAFGQVNEGSERDVGHLGQSQLVMRSGGPEACTISAGQPLARGVTVARLTLDYLPLNAVLTCENAGQVRA